MSMYRIPSDVERPDRIVGPFTARQLALLTATGVALLLTWAATRVVVPVAVFAAVAAPVAALATATILTTRDGMSGDQLLLTALRHRMRPRRLIAVGSDQHDRAGAPGWLTATATGPRPVTAQPITTGTAPLPRTVTGAGGSVWSTSVPTGSR